MVELPLQVILFKPLAPAGSPRTGFPDHARLAFEYVKGGHFHSLSGLPVPGLAESCSVSPILACNCLAHQFGFSRLPSHPVNKIKKAYQFINSYFFISVAVEHLTGMSIGERLSEQRESETSLTIEFQYVGTRGQSKHWRVKFNLRNVLFGRFFLYLLIVWYVIWYFWM